MLNKLFFIILRSVAIPVAAIYLLSRTALGEEGALIAVGLALLVVNLIGIALNMLKLLGNTLMLKPGAVVYYIFSIIIQAISVLLIWGYYFSEYQGIFE